MKNDFVQFWMLFVTFWVCVCDTVDRVKWRKNFSFLFVIMFIRHAIKYGMEMSRTVEYEVIEMNFAIDYHHIECVNS